MAKERIVNVRFWRDNYILSLRPDARLLFLWTITNPMTELCGAYEAALSTIEIETGLKAKRIVEIFGQFQADGKILYRDGWVIVKNFAKHQHGTSKNIKAGIARTLNDCPDWVKDTVSNGMHTVSHLNLDSVRQPIPIPIPRPSEEEEAPPPPPKRATPKLTRIPEPFPIMPEMWAWLAENIPDLENPNTAHADFVEYWTNAPPGKAEKLNWKLTWQRGMRLARKWQEEDKQNGTNHKRTGPDRRTDADILRDSAEAIASKYSN